MIAIVIVQGNVNQFKIIVIIVSSIGDINDIIVSSIEGISVGASVLGVMFFLGVGGNFEILNTISQ